MLYNTFDWESLNPYIDPKAMQISMQVREAMDRRSRDGGRRWHVVWLAHQGECTSASERLTTGEWMIIEIPRYMGTTNTAWLFIGKGDLDGWRRGFPVLFARLG